MDTETGTSTIASEPPEPVLPSTKRGKWLVLAILGVALAVRLIVVIEVQRDYVPQTDALHFDYIATELANGDGFGQAILPGMDGPTAMRAPGYPFALAAVYLVFGDHSWTAGLLLNAALGVGVVALTGLVAAQLFSRRVATVAMAIAAVHPTMVLLGSSLQLEPLLVVLSLGALAATLQHRRTPRGLTWPLVAGLLLGLAILTRELAFAFLLPMAWLLFTAGPDRATLRRPTRAAVMRPVVLTVAAFLVVFPWTIRNALTLEEFVPITTSAGVGLAGTYNETSRTNDDDPGLWIPPWNDEEMYEVILDEADDPTEYNIDGALRDASLDIIRDHPTYPLEVGFWNTVRMFDLDLGDYSLLIAPSIPYPRWLVRLAIAAGYVVLALAIAGAFRRAARRIPFAIWAIPLTMYVLLVVPLPGSIRYRASLEPFFVMLAALAATPVLERIGRQRGWLPDADDGTAEPAPASAS
jgi:4-amino-4-deoxy-L-arabinose transferase-like glycosyltransferase